MIQINHLMRDLGTMVSEQSPIIAQVEQNVTGATDNIIAGNQQLLSASRHQVNLTMNFTDDELNIFFTFF